MKMLPLLIAAMPMAACTFHSGPRQLTPEGEPVVARLVSGKTVEGQLLAITDLELLLKTKDGYGTIPRSELRRVTVTRYKTSFTGRWDRLTLYCSYPQGLGVDQTRSLLQRAGQAEVIRLADR